MAAQETCGLCGRTPAEGWAWILDIRYCHGDTEPSCYERAMQAGIARGLAQVEAGDVVDLGSFAQYLEDDDDGQPGEDVQAGGVPGHAVDAPPVLAPGPAEATDGPSPGAGPGAAPAPPHGEVGEGVSDAELVRRMKTWAEREGDE